jgi:phage/plasmid-like protein (TIGR03299 family)
MAHNLNFNNGVASFASRKEVAWHGLGKVVEAMTSEEAIVLGGLDFEVEKRPLYINSGDSLVFEEAKQFKNINRRITQDSEGNVSSVYRKNIIVPNQYATVRTDLDLPLGIVGERYHVIQNKEAFDFIDSIIGQGVADYETVGALGNGETVFITCKLKEEMVINKDLIDKYLLVSMSHDGSSSIVVMFTPIRVVCNNTLTLALEGKNNKMTIRHTKSAKEKLELSKKVLGIVDRQTLTYKEAFGALSNITIYDKQLPDFIKQSFSLKPDEKGNFSTKAENIVKSVINYYHNGVGQENIVGTAWGAFNGVTGYLQNVKEYSNPEAKFKNTFMTTSVDVRQKAFNLLIAQ